MGYFVLRRVPLLISEIKLLCWIDKLYSQDCVKACLEFFPLLHSSVGNLSVSCQFVLMACDLLELRIDGKVLFLSCPYPLSAEHNYDKRSIQFNSSELEEGCSSLITV